MLLTGREVCGLSSLIDSMYTISQALAKAQRGQLNLAHRDLHPQLSHTADKRFSCPRRATIPVLCCYKSHLRRGERLFLLPISWSQKSRR